MTLPTHSRTLDIPRFDPFPATRSTCTNLRYRPPSLPDCSTSIKVQLFPHSISSRRPSISQSASHITDTLLAPVADVEIDGRSPRRELVSWRDNIDIYDKGTNEPNDACTSSTTTAFWRQHGMDTLDPTRVSCSRHRRNRHRSNFSDH